MKKLFSKQDYHVKWYPSYFIQIQVQPDLIYSTFIHTRFTKFSNPNLHTPLHSTEWSNHLIPKFPISYKFSPKINLHFFSLLSTKSFTIIQPIKAFQTPSDKAKTPIAKLCLSPCFSPSHGPHLLPFHLLFVLFPAANDNSTQGRPIKISAYNNKPPLLSYSIQQPTAASKTFPSCVRGKRVIPACTSIKFNFSPSLIDQ